MAIAQKYRLTKDRDINDVFARGKTVKGRFFFIKFLPNQLHHLRLAVLISKKISKGAVKRNLIRRQIHSALTETHKKFFNNSWDAVITVTPAILEKDSKEIKSNLDQTIKQIQ